MSPLHQLRTKLDVKKIKPVQALGLPQVKFWSDIVWIVWASLAKTDAEASSLKYIFRHYVVTEETIFVIERIFGVNRGNFPDGEEWPGRKLVPNEENFWAVLGTPHGKLLWQCFWCIKLQYGRRAGYNTLVCIEADINIR